ncbi:MAG: EAL domain-containing protein [Methylobacterium sp.]|nr:EAL domain-containing protein [Methylobacterium sp.]MCA3601198.1 EAL domain-containing protein [Methylobacterium sp.]MCA3602442.1 EAL domain-containing protein [Methylobacterium sp.]MCA3607724.1 EAL domain-containing protein [Methylobacterium sp.]MCA3609248.1 EAL domain-containing protein [Methylobacterium sp.]
MRRVVSLPPGYAPNRKVRGNAAPRVSPLALLLLFLALLAPLSAAHALDAIRVTPQSEAIDLLPAIQTYQSREDRLEIQTARDANGIVRRIEVQAREAGARPRWIAFALQNDSNEIIERVLVAPRFKLTGSGVFWPDLASVRIEAITASHGFRPEREEGTEADLFAITLEPGAIVTFVAELRGSRLPELTLWDPEVYKDKLNALTLYRGIVTGIAGLLAIFLTIVLTLRAALIFPASAALAWAVLVYLGIDFGFIGRFFALRPEVENIYRAGAEAVLGGTLLVFLFAYLNLNRWHARYGHITLVWLGLLGVLIALSSIDPGVASGIARISMAAIAVIGFVLIVYLAFHRYDRAIMLVPTWFLLLVWVGGAALVVSGQVTNDVAAPALLGGLVLIVLMIAFTVMQNVFSSGAVISGAVPDAERKALAFVGGGDLLFDWDVSDDHMHLSPELEMHLGLERGALDGRASVLINVIHPADRDRYRAALDAMIEQKRGRIGQDFRLMARDGSTVWYRLKARPVVNRDGEVIRIVGSLLDVTAVHTTQDRLLHDAIHDHLTGLPNRRLLLDRIETALINARHGGAGARKPALILLDIDRFKQVNESVGVSAGDIILLTIARRLARVARAGDTLARISGDSFALVVLSEQEPQRVVALADLVRRAVSTPITHGERQIYLTGSVGVALLDETSANDKEAFIRNAELAAIHAKRTGRDRVEIYRASMRNTPHDRFSLSNDLRRAIERSELEVQFQPIVRLEDRSIAGFEALIRWNHPRLGRLPPGEFISIAEESGLIVDIGLFVLETTARELSAWQQSLVVDPPIFASVNVSSRQLIRQDILQDLKNVLLRHPCARGSLKLEITETLVMENPEYAAQILEKARELGAGLALDDFGTGFSSLSYLQRFPFDTLKIDQSFVRHDETGKRPLILRSIVGLAQDLGMDIVAEGAESEADTVELFQLGCQFAQGYVFGPAISIDQARKLIGLSSAA